MATKVLMVCLGNICRSPLAEGILQSKASTGTLVVDSSGTAGYHIGEPPDSRSIQVARKYGIDISHQRCRQFSVQDFDAFDHIYAMDKNNYRDILALATHQDHRDKVKLLLDGTMDGEEEVPDPYYGGVEGFEKVFQLIDGACDRIVEKLNGS
ncbi:MAG: low molecular weight protein-tyrosine-phosphatase [Flavobacteriaceae bacterium]